MAFPKLLQKLFQNNGAGDKLREDVMPKDYLPTSGGTIDGSVTINGTTTTNESGSTTYKEGIKFGWGSEISQSTPNGLDIWAKKGDATTVLALYGEANEAGTKPGIFMRAGDGTSTKSMRLDTTGLKIGCDVTVTGSRYIKSATSTGGNLFIDSTGCALHGNNTGYQDGASLLLRSSTYPNDQKGKFFIFAALSSSQNCALVGTPTGTLTWAGKDLSKTTIVAESYSANSWYRKYSDGWIEQGGWLVVSHSTSTQTKNLATPFSSTAYSLLFQAEGNGAFCDNLNITAKTTSTFGIASGTQSNGDNQAKTFNWYACGK